MVSGMNARGRSPYIVIQRGGQKGGGAELTETGKHVVKSFERLNQRVQAVIRKEKEILNWI
jgi:molybdate transport system regulatory protein